MYRPYNELKAETDAVKQLDIRMIAEEMGFTFKKRGSHLECNEVSGMILFTQTNTFHNFYTGETGSVIDLVMKFENRTFPETVRELSKYLSGGTVKFQSYQSQTENKPFLLPPVNKDYRRAFAYLTKSRAIDRELVSRLMHEHRIYEEADHHNVVFLAGDRAGHIQHGFIRGTITGKQFRGDVPGSNKDYGFSLQGNTNRLIVFEAPIDLLSYKTLYPESQDHLIALGMLAQSPVYLYLKEYPEVKQISFVLDNDKKGREATRKYEHEFQEKGYSIIRDPASVRLWQTGKKDMNEYLVAIRQRMMEQKKQPCRR